MEILTILREKTESGQEDLSLVPAFPENWAQYKQLPKNRIIRVNIVVKRNPKSNSRMWALCGYFYHNHHERYNGYWNSIDELYQWLKLKVGYALVIGKGSGAVRIPRETKFVKQTDEIEYLEKFLRPGVIWMAREIGSDVYGFHQASIEWRNSK